MLNLLGLDLGTSSFKVAAFTTEGTQIGVVSRPTPWREGPLGSEMDPVQFAAVVRELLDECAERWAPEGVAAIGVTGMAETSFVELDDGRILPARAWNQRGTRELPELTSFAVTGLVDAARTPLVELRSLRDDGVRVRAWHGLPDYAVQTLGGARVIERSLATRTGLVDVRTGAWHGELVEWAGIADVELPALHPAGTPAGQVADGPCAGAVLTVAGHDHVTAAVGAGADDPSAIFDSLGTGEAIIAELRATTAGLDVEIIARTTAAGINVGLGVGARNVVLFAGLGTGNRFNLLLSALAALGHDREAVLVPEARPEAGHELDALETLPAAATELLDTLFGADWQQLRTSGDGQRLTAASVTDLDQARALWWAAVARAALNGRATLDTIAELSPQATRLVAAGGWLGNAGIRGIRERILGPFTRPAVDQAGARGAALFAGLAAGIFPTRDAFPPSPTIQEQS